jgi:hypothetical protein
VSPVRYELGFYIPEDDILHSHRREYLKSSVDNERFRVLRYVLGVVTTSLSWGRCSDLQCSWNPLAPQSDMS